MILRIRILRRSHNRHFRVSRPALPGNGVTAQQADALNSLFDDLARSIGYAEAVYASLNRAQGASDAESSYWEAQQLRAATTYSSKLGISLNSLPLLLTNFQSALGASAFPNATVSAQDALTQAHEVMPQATTYSESCSITVQTIRRKLLLNKRKP